MKRIEKATLAVIGVAASTMGIGPLWALLAVFGGNWQM